MRKILAILLLSLYLLSSIGFTVNAHYCGGDLAAVALFDNASCCCDDQGKADDCCKNEIKTIKISDDQLKAEFQIKKISNSPIEGKVDRILMTLKPQVADLFIPLSISLPKAPDRSFLPPLYKRNHSFLFYS